MYCAKCGETVPDGSTVCSNCGESVYVPENDIQEKNHKNGAKCVVIAIICIVCVVALVLLIPVFRKAHFKKSIMRDWTKECRDSYGSYELLLDFRDGAMEFYYHGHNRYETIDQFYWEVVSDNEIRLYSLNTGVSYVYTIEISGRHMKITPALISDDTEEWWYSYSD